MPLLTIKSSWKPKDVRLWTIGVGIVCTLSLIIGGSLFWKKEKNLPSTPLFPEARFSTDPLMADFARHLQVVLSLVEQSYVEPLSQQKKEEMFEGALIGMVKTLDAHSSYLTPEMMKELNESMRGQFCGVGLEVMPDATGVLRVISAIDETSAAKAGLRAGDVILKINQKWVFDLPPQETVRQMRGPPGSTLTLTIRRGESTPFDVMLKRHTVNFKSVQWAREKGHIGYLRISYFDDKTKRLVMDALSSLQKATLPPLRGLLIDLRNNPGGLLDQAIGVADLFLEKGAIVSTRTADNPEGTIVYANPKTKQTIHKVPLVVLVSAGSASGAELLAGALQENYRAIIVGERTFGKASMQAVYPLENGSGLKLTIARYDTPSGRSLQAEGIQPDIMIPPNYEVISTPVAPPIREENLHAHLSSDYIPLPKTPSPPASALREKTSSPQNINDFQKAYALDLLRALAVHQHNLNNRLEEANVSSIPFETIAQRE